VDLPVAERGGLRPGDRVFDPTAAGSAPPFANQRRDLYCRISAAEDAWDPLADRAHDFVGNGARNGCHLFDGDDGPTLLAKDDHLVLDLGFWDRPEIDHGHVHGDPPHHRDALASH